MRIMVAGKPVDILSTLPVRGWSMHNKGYVIYTSRKKGSLPRGKSAHVAAMEALIGGPIPAGMVPHHQDFNKLNNCPCNLVLMDAAFNVSPARQCPYTGQYMSIDLYAERYGIRRAA